ncbi:MAG: hypothetical protein P8171_18620 [Candidatus Thiodiazotropha sp.]
MIDQSRVTSGYHFETLLGARYLEHLFLSAIDTGDMPISATIPIPLPPRLLQINLHAPTPARDYPVNPAATAPITNPASLQIINIQDGTPLVPGSSLHHVLLTISVVLDVVDIGTGVTLVSSSATTLDVLVSLQRDSESLPGGGSIDRAHTNVRFDLQLQNVAGALVTALTGAPFNFTVTDIVAALSGLLPPSLPFDITGRDGPLRSIDMRFLPGDTAHPPAIGLYANLVLRITTIEARRPAYSTNPGSTTNAQNFLEQGQDYAIAMNPILFSGSGNQNAVGRHFWDLLNELRLTGRLEIFGTDVPVNIPLNRRLLILYVRLFSRGDGLRMSIRCRYNVEGLITSLDPEGTIQIDFRPEWDADGILRWTSSIGVTTKGLAIIFSDEFYFVSFFINRFLEAFYRQEYASDPGFATIMDLLAATVTTGRKQWDPFFISLHQIVVNVPDVQSTRDGLALSGTVRGLGRKRFPVDNLVIRDKLRAPDGTLSGLRYVIPGFGTDAIDLNNTFLATDRLQLTPLAPVPDYPDSSASLVTLSLDDIRDRMDQEGFPPPIVYRIVRVQPFVEEFEDHTRSTLVRLMGLSLRERDRLYDAVWDERFAEIREVVLEREDELRAEAAASVSDDADADEIEQAFRRLLFSATTASTLRWFDTDAGADTLRTAYDSLLRLEMHPHEWGLLQEMGVLEVQGYRLINRMGRFYYRDDPRWSYDEPGEDEPDDSLIDNLAELPHIVRLEVDLTIPTLPHARILAPASVLEAGTFTLYRADGSLAESLTFTGLDHSAGHQFSADADTYQFEGWRLCWSDPNVQLDTDDQTGEICTAPHERT